MHLPLILIATLASIKWSQVMEKNVLEKSINAIVEERKRKSTQLYALEKFNFRNISGCTE